MLFGVDDTGSGAGAVTVRYLEFGHGGANSIQTREMKRLVRCAQALRKVGKTGIGCKIRDVVGGHAADGRRALGVGWQVGAPWHFLGRGGLGGKDP